MNDARKSVDPPRNPVDLEVLNNLAEAQGEGEPDLIVELIDLYLADTPQRVAAMHEALVNSDNFLLARAAHALRGSSSILGAGQVAESCAELELLARDVSLQELAVVLERLEQEVRSLRNTFLIERQKRSGQTK